MDDSPLHFIDESIEVHYDLAPLLEKKPACPQGFTWRGVEYGIVEMLAEWQNFRRRGRMARNMIPAHLQQASRAGSWGVGRFFFRVQVSDGRIFDIYYDRAPEDSAHRKGNWFILCERKLSK